MSKTPEEMAEEYRKAWGDEQLYKIRHEHKRFDWDDALIDGFLAGYKAAKAIVEEELQAVQAHRAEYPGLGAAQYALKNVLAKMGSK